MERSTQCSFYRAVVSENSSFSGLDDDGSGTTTCVDSSFKRLKLTLQLLVIRSGRMTTTAIKSS